MNKIAEGRRGNHPIKTKVKVWSRLKNEEKNGVIFLLNQHNIFCCVCEFGLDRYKL
jgi:hypothetical protein